MTAARPVPAVVAVADADGWRDWLTRHAGDRDEAWLVIPHRHSGIAGPTHLEAITEALCFGWIDGVNQRHDEHSTRQRFTPRRPRSAWSVTNRELVGRLIDQGRMTAAGLAAIETAKANGMWDLLVDAQRGVVPDGLRTALDADPNAADGWNSMSASARRAALESLARARRDETRQRRIEAIVSAARSAFRI